jgi:uncharacterized protein (TIGR03435 family)
VGPTAVLERGQAWIDSDRYQISAKAGDAVRKEMINGPMLRALLEERFRLKFHRETREVPIYSLTVAESGLKLQPSSGGSCIPGNEGCDRSLGQARNLGVADPGEASLRA